MTSVIALSDFLLCVGSALIIGIILAGCYMWRTRYTKSFAATLAMLPAIVCVVIMMVNGNVGAGVAVAGAFSLVRFRSVPGSAREISAIFLAMGAGCELVQVKTTNMGSLFRLTYNLKLKNANEEKNLIDELRCRNGNLEITVSRQTNVIGEL